MKLMNLQLHLLTFLGLVFLLSCSSTTYISPQADSWQKIGQRSVTKTADRDEIKVGANKGSFNAIKLTIRKAPINMHRCVVHFENGGTQEIKFRKNMKRGSSTAAQDLRGPDRRIEKVVFWYDTVNKARQRATVELWART